MTSGDVADHSLATRDRPVSTMREEPCRVARGAEVQAFDGLDTRVTEHALADRPEVEVAAAQRLVAEASAIVGGDVGADFVAARSDSRTDDGGKAAAERGNPRFDDSLEQAVPSSVEQRQGRAAVHAPECDRKAVGSQLQQR